MPSVPFQIRERNLRIKTFINASRELVIDMQDVIKNNFDVKIYNTNGQQVYANQLLHAGSNQVYKFTLSNKLLPGIYSLQINAPGEKYSQMVLIK